MNFITEAQLQDWLARIMADRAVIGPVRAV